MRKLYEAGQYSDGSYSFGSMTHDEHAQDSTSYSSIATLVRQATGTWVNDRSGISTSGVNGTFLYSANGSMASAESGSSSGCYTLHEEETYANERWLWRAGPRQRPGLRRVAQPGR